MITSTRYILLTNIEFVQLLAPSSVPPLRLWCHALLITNPDSHDSLFDQNTVRGFGTGSAWSVFTHWLPPGKVNFELKQNLSDKSAVFLSHNGDVKPLFYGAELRLSDVISFFLQSSDASASIDVHEQTGNLDALWDLLVLKVSKYWKAPNMPLASYFSTHAVQSALRSGS